MGRKREQNVGEHGPERKRTLSSDHRGRLRRLGALRAEGWVFATVKDFAAKTSPNLVPYAELPEAQRAKDALFQRTVRTMAEILGPVLSR